MTRVEQWFKRRKKYLARSKAMYNAVPRPWHNPFPFPGHTETSHPGHHGGQIMGTMKPPRVSKRTKRDTRPPLVPPGAPPAYHQLGGGYATPPYVKFYPGHQDPPLKHSRYARINYGPRVVHVRAKLSAGAPKAPRKNIRAWTYWKIVGKWPMWDPLHRTPVDLDTYGEEDHWEPH